MSRSGKAGTSQIVAPANTTPSAPESKWKHPIVVAALTGSLAIAGTAWSLYQTAKYQRDLEVEKLEWQKKDAVFRSSVELANRIAAALYQIGSFLETAKLHPDRIDAAYDAHEAKMKELMPPVVGAHVSVAAHDYALFERFAPMIIDISAIDGCVTGVYRTLKGSTREVAINSLLEGHSAALSSLATRVYEVTTNRKSSIDLAVNRCDLAALSALAK